MTDQDRADTTGVRAVVVLVLASASLLAQQAPPVFKSSVDIVPVYATVTDLKGTFTRGLTRDDFEVLDDGKAQQIVSFSEEAQAISVSVILDTSGSMAEARPKMLAAAGVFLDQLRPDDRAMLGSLVYAGRPFTSDKARLRSAMDLDSPRSGLADLGGARSRGDRAAARNTAARDRDVHGRAATRISASTTF